MSIVSMMSAAALADVKRRRRSLSTRRRGAEAVGASSEVLAKLTRFIPTEAVALYVAILPFMVPKDVPLTEQDFTGRWYLAGAVAIAAVLFAVGIYRRVVLGNGGTFKWPPRRTLTVLLAYGAWVAAIPGSPLNAFGWYTPSTGAIIGIGASATISLLHIWLGEPEE